MTDNAADRASVYARLEQMYPSIGVPVDELWTTVKVSVPEGAEAFVIPVFVGTRKQAGVLLSKTPSGPARRMLKDQVFGMMYGMGAGED